MGEVLGVRRDGAVRTFGNDYERRERSAESLTKRAYGAGLLCDWPAMPSGQRASPTTRPRTGPGAHAARPRPPRGSNSGDAPGHVHDPAPELAPMDWAEIVDLVSNYARSQGLRWDDAARELAADAQDRRDAS